MPQTETSCACNCNNADSQALIALTKPSLANGMSSVGSAIGLLYGVATKKRWWMVILFMAGGGALGRGIGYVVEK